MIKFDEFIRFGSVNFVKLFPVVLTVYLAVGMIGSYFNIIDYKLYTSHWTLICHCYPIHIGLWFLSYLLRFCEWHRILIYSDILILVLCDLYDKKIMIPNELYLMGAFLLLSSVAASIMYFKYGCFNKRTVKNPSKHCKMD